MKPAGYLYFSENIACHCTSEDADEMTISVGTPYYTADQLRQAKVEVLTKAMERIDPCLMVTQGVLRQMIAELEAEK